MTPEEYYRHKAEEGRADEVRNGIAIFRIGQGDVHMFPQLLQIEELWVMKSGAIQTIHINTVSNPTPIRSLYEYH